MGINKVNYGNTTLIDTSNVTVTADKLAQGYTALDNTGTLITGTSTSGGYVSQDANGYIVVSPTADLPVLKTKSITANGTYNASSDNADGYSSVSVNVQSSFTVGTATATGNDTYNYGTITFTVQAQPKAFRVILDVVGYNPYSDGYIESPHGTSIYYTYDGSSYGHVTEIFYDGTNVSMLAEINGHWYYALIPTFTYDSYGNTKYLTIDTRQSYPDYPQWYPRFIRGLTYELTYLY